MTKSLHIPQKPTEAVQGFVQAGNEPRVRELSIKAEKGDMVRITLDLPKSLHRKLKIHVAGEGVTIADFMRSLLDNEL